jgi:hypothetical protein
LSFFLLLSTAIDLDLHSTQHNMSARSLLASFLFGILALVPAIFGNSDVKIEGPSSDEIIALTRDHLGRNHPDELLKGFIPVWAIVIYMISGVFAIVAVLSGICHLLGCRNPHKERNIKSFD